MKLYLNATHSPILDVSFARAAFLESCGNTEREAIRPEIYQPTASETMSCNGEPFAGAMRAATPPA